MRCAVVLLMLAVAPHDVSAQQRVAFVGDSHMTILGPMMERRVRTCAQPVGIVSRVGWSLRRYRLAGDLAMTLRVMRPTVVVVALGSNDYGIAHVRRYRPRVRWILDAVRQSGARRIVWISPPAVDAERSDVTARVAAVHRRVGAMQREVVPALGAEWIDAWPVTAGYNGRDGYHLTRRGYRRLAAVAADRVCNRAPAP